MNSPRTTVSPSPFFVKSLAQHPPFTLKNDFHLLSEVANSNLFHDRQFPDRELLYFANVLIALTKRGSFQSTSRPPATSLQQRFWSIIDYYREHNNLDICGPSEGEPAPREDGHYLPLCLKSVKKIVSDLSKTDVTSETATVKNIPTSPRITRKKPKRFSGFAPSRRATTPKVGPSSAAPSASDNEPQSPKYYPVTPRSPAIFTPPADPIPRLSPASPPYSIARPFPSARAAFQHTPASQKKQAVVVAPVITGALPPTPTTPPTSNKATQPFRASCTSAKRPTPSGAVIPAPDLKRAKPNSPTTSGARVLMPLLSANPAPCIVHEMPAHQECANTGSDGLLSSPYSAGSGEVSPPPLKPSRSLPQPHPDLSKGVAVRSVDITVARPTDPYGASPFVAPLLSQDATCAKRTKNAPKNSATDTPIAEYRMPRRSADGNVAKVSERPVTRSTIALSMPLPKHIYAAPAGNAPKQSLTQQATPQPTTPQHTGTSTPCGPLTRAARAKASGKQQIDVVIKKTPVSQVEKKGGATSIAAIASNKKAALSSTIGKTRRMVLKPKVNTGKDVSEAPGLKENTGSVLTAVRQLLIEAEERSVRENYVALTSEGRGGDTGTLDRAVKVIDDWKHLVKGDLCQQKEIRLRQLELDEGRFKAEKEERDRLERETQLRRLEYELAERRFEAERKDKKAEREDRQRSMQLQESRLRLDERRVEATLRLEERRIEQTEHESLRKRQEASSCVGKFHS